MQSLDAQLIVHARLCSRSTTGAALSGNSTRTALACGPTTTGRRVDDARAFHVVPVRAGDARLVLHAHAPGIFIDGAPAPAAASVSIRNARARVAIPMPTAHAQLRVYARRAAGVARSAGVRLLVRNALACIAIPMLAADAELIVHARQHVVARARFTPFVRHVRERVTTREQDQPQPERLRTGLHRSTLHMRAHDADFVRDRIKQQVRALFKSLALAAVSGSCTQPGISANS
jgi:hypothetical protein